MVESCCRLQNRKREGTALDNNNTAAVAADGIEKQMQQVLSSRAPFKLLPYFPRQFSGAEIACLTGKSSYELSPHC